MMAGLIGTGGLVLTGCGEQGYSESGTVAAKEVDVECKASAKKSKAPTCHTELEFDLITSDGRQVEVKAHSREHYDRCAVGAAFPACTEGKR